MRTWGSCYDFGVSGNPPPTLIQVHDSLQLLGQCPVNDYHRTFIGFDLDREFSAFPQQRCQVREGDRYLYLLSGLDKVGGAD